MLIKDLGQNVDYETTWRAMKEFTLSRNEQTEDEIWLLEHPPVYTQGQAGKPEHIITPTDIPIVETDRGGQVTYHGPGQLIAYMLLDLKRLGIGPRECVCRLEKSVINLLADMGITAVGDRKRPGVYVDGKKIAAIGLRVKKGYTYHGISFNVDMELSPFEAINPCGYTGLQVTDLATLKPNVSTNRVKPIWGQQLLKWCQTPIG